MSRQKLMQRVLSVALVCGAVLWVTETASAQHHHHHHHNAGYNPQYNPTFNPGYNPGYNPAFNPGYNPGFNIPLAGGGVDHVQFTPNGVLQDIVTPQGRIDIYNGYNGQRFEVIQPNGGVPIVLPY